MEKLALPSKLGDFMAFSVLPQHDDHAIKNKQSKKRDDYSK